MRAPVFADAAIFLVRAFSGDQHQRPGLHSGVYNGKNRSVFSFSLTKPSKAARRKTCLNPTFPPCLGAAAISPALAAGSQRPIAGAPPRFRPTPSPTPGSIRGGVEAADLYWAFAGTSENRTHCRVRTTARLFPHAYDELLPGSPRRSRFSDKWFIFGR